MKRLFSLMLLCITLILCSCTNIQGMDGNTKDIEKSVKNENASDFKISEAQSTPTLTATPTEAEQISSNTENSNNNLKNIAQYNGHFYNGKAVVLTYHHISNKPFSGITIKPKRFENDLVLLKNNGFNVISLSKLISCMQGNDILPENAVVITFDDGIESFYKYAYPLLKKYNMPAVNFIITSRTEAYRPSTEDFNPLSPEEVKEMYASGLVDIESHTDNSHDYAVINEKLEKAGKLAYRIYNPNTKTYESEDDYKKRVLNDLNKSSQIIFKYTGSYPQMLCFPFGQYNKRVIELSKQTGFKYFITTQYGYNKQNSRSNIILRIRAGDSNLSSEKLIQNIVDCGNNIKRIEKKKTEVKPSSTISSDKNQAAITVSPTAPIQNSNDVLKQ